MCFPKMIEIKPPFVLYFVQYMQYKCIFILELPSSYCLKSGRLHTVHSSRVEPDLMLPQKLGILLVLQMLRSDSHTVSSTHEPQNSSLQTSNLTHLSTSCHNCENDVLCTVTIFSCCTYRTVFFFKADFWLDLEDLSCPS